MANILRLWKSDFKRLFANAISAIITLGLILMPSLFAWYNIVACWNVFDNTGNLTVAVANTDEGYQSDLFPLKVNVGDQVVSALRANDQIDWTFTDEEDAIDGARSGRYYAAVVIPPGFSRDMLTFYTKDMQHADIVYYANEKKSAIAPKITDQGADTISYEVNAVFAQTLSEVSLSMVEALSSFSESDDWDGHIAAMTGRIRDMADALDDAAKVLELYRTLAQSCQELAANSAALATQAAEAVDSTLDAATARTDTVPATVDALRTSSDSLSEALQTSSEGFGAVSTAVDNLFDQATTDAAGAAENMRAYADTLDGHSSFYRNTADMLEDVGNSLPADLQPSVNALVSRLRSVSDQIDSVAVSLRGAADKLDVGMSAIDADRKAAKADAGAAAQTIADLKDQYDTDVKPGLVALTDDARAMADAIGGVASTLEGVGDTLADSASSAAEVMGGTAEKIAEATEKLHGVSQDLRDMALHLDDALASGDREALRAVLGADVTVLSQALSAPVGIERIAVYPVENFGSSMAPLYTSLALFIGALLILVVIKATVSPAVQEEAGLQNVKPRQLFFGRFGVMAFVAFCQATVMALGNMFFLQVQVDSPVLFFMCFWGASLVFTFFIYALVVSFANLGKAITVLLLIVQVTGCGGSFPLQLLPWFVQALSPWLPATHVVNAMRVAMMGGTPGEFWMQMGYLALFTVPAALLGLVLRKPLARFMEWYVEEVESSKLVG